MVYLHVWLVDNEVARVAHLGTPFLPFTPVRFTRISLREDLDTPLFTGIRLEWFLDVRREEDNSTLYENGILRVRDRISLGFFLHILSRSPQSILDILY